MGQAALLSWPRLQYLLAKRKAITRYTREREVRGGRLAKEGKGVRTGERATRTNALKFPFLFWLFFSSFLSIFRGRHLKASDKLTIGTAIAPEPGQPFFFFGGRNILFSIPRSFFAPFLLLLLYILICCQLLSARLHGVVGTSRVICSNTVCPFTTNKREY